MGKCCLFFLLGLGVAALAKTAQRKMEIVHREETTSQIFSDKPRAHENLSIKLLKTNNTFDKENESTTSVEDIRNIPFSDVTKYAENLRINLWEEREKVIPFNFRIYYPPNQDDQAVQDMSSSGGSGDLNGMDLITNQRKFEFYEGEVNFSKMKLPITKSILVISRNPNDGYSKCKVDFLHKEERESDYCSLQEKNREGKLILSSLFRIEERITDSKLPIFGAQMDFDRARAHSQIIGFHFLKKKWVKIGEVNWKPIDAQSYLRLMGAEVVLNER